MTMPGVVAGRSFTTSRMASVPPGGSADGNHQVTGQALSGQAGEAVGLHNRRLRLLLGSGLLTDTGGGGDLHLDAQLIQEGLGLRRSITGRLADKVHRTGFQGIQHPEGQGTYHNHRHRVNRDQPLDEVNAVELGHFHIHSHNIGIELPDLLECFLCVSSHSDYFDPGVCVQAVFQNGAEEERIIHNQQTDLFAKGKVRHRGQLLL